MTSDFPRSPNPAVPSQGPPLATISYEGRFWEVFVEFDDDPRHPDTSRARLCFFPADPGEEDQPVRTAVILIEDSYEEVMAKARSLEEHLLQGLLRSALP